MNWSLIIISNNLIFNFFLDKYNSIYDIDDHNSLEDLHGKRAFRK